MIEVADLTRDRRRWVDRSVFFKACAGGIVMLLLWGTATLAQDAGDPSPAVDAHTRALLIVLEATDSEDPFLRANAVEAIQPIEKRLLPVIQLALDDPHPAVRFAALATIGKLQLEPLSPQARRFLKDESPSVQAAAMFALDRCHQPVDISPMAAMLTSQDPRLRSNVAMLIGYNGDPSAAPMLRELAKTPMPRASAVQEAIVRIQIAEALVRLGDDSSLSALRAGAYSQFDEVRILAVTAMGELQDRRMERALFQLVSMPPIELQIAAAGALAQMGRFQEGVDIVLEASQSDIPTVRAQAALTLGHFPDLRARQAIESLLDDPVQQVRLSASAAVLRSLGPNDHDLNLGSPPDDNFSEKKD